MVLLVAGALAPTAKAADGEAASDAAADGKSARFGACWFIHADLVMRYYSCSVARFREIVQPTRRDSEKSRSLSQQEWETLVKHDSLARGRRFAWTEKHFMASEHRKH